MNLLADPSLWMEAANTTTSPPISWNPEEERYEVLVSDPVSASKTWQLVCNEPAPAGAVISFDYEISAMSRAPGQNATYLRVLNAVDLTNYYAVAIENGSTGTITVSIPEGQQVAIILTHTENGFYFSNFYNFEALVTPLAVVAPPVNEALPWWLCKAPPPTEEVPVRPVGFVPFAEYDTEFKFPLKSSRVPGKIKRPEGCVACGPTLIDATPPVDPEDPTDPENPGGDDCQSFLSVQQVTVNEGPAELMSEANWQNPPQWFTWDSNGRFFIRFPDVDSTVVYEMGWAIGRFSETYGNAFPFPGPDGILQGEVAQYETGFGDWENLDWTCVEVNRYGPA